MAKVYKDNGNYIIYCPVCEVPHVITSDWLFNGDYEKPTFKPSLLVQYPYGEEKKERRCHSYITEGKIQYLPDCTHILAGATIELPDESKWDW